MRTRVALALITLCGGLAAGCGSSGTASTASRGGAVFAQSCRACHSVIGNESLHRQGGDLLVYRWTRGQLLEFTREMPVRHPLSTAQLDAVVDYVLGLQRGR